MDETTAAGEAVVVVGPRKLREFAPALQRQVLERAAAVARETGERPAVVIVVGDAVAEGEALEAAVALLQARADGTAPADVESWPVEVEVPEVLAFASLPAADRVALEQWSAERHRAREAVPPLAELEDEAGNVDLVLLPAGLTDPPRVRPPEPAQPPSAPYHGVSRRQMAIDAAPDDDIDPETGRPRVLKAIRKLRHWKQRFLPNAAFCWRKNAQWPRYDANGQFVESVDFPAGSALPRWVLEQMPGAKLERFWESGFIELLQFEEPDVASGQLEERPPEPGVPIRGRRAAPRVVDPDDPTGVRKARPKKKRSRRPRRASGDEKANPQTSAGAGK